MKTIFCILVFLIALTSCQHKFADIVYVIDEGVPKEGLMWVDYSIMQIENHLTSSGIGDQPSLTNLYGLVLYGSEGNIQSNVRRILANNTLELSTAQVFSNNLKDIENTVFSVDDMHDGYGGLSNALDIIFRPASNRIIIFVTDRERNIVFTNITRKLLINKILDTQVLLTTILKVNLQAVNTNNQTFPALGIVYSNNTQVYYTSDNKVDTTPFARIFDTNISSSMIYDYAFLPEISSLQEFGSNSTMFGSIWDMQNIITNNSVFNDLFFRSLTSQVQQSPQFTVSCSNCLNSTCYFEEVVLLTRSRAIELCSKRGGSLAKLSQSQLNSLKNIFTRPSWVYSFNSNSGCYIINNGNSSTVDCNQLYGAICEVNRSPLIGC